MEKKTLSNEGHSILKKKPKPPTQQKNPNTEQTECLLGLLLRRYLTGWANSLQPGCLLDILRFLIVYSTLPES